MLEELWRWLKNVRKLKKRSFFTFRSRSTISILKLIFPSFFGTKTIISEQSLIVFEIKWRRTISTSERSLFFLAETSQLFEGFSKSSTCVGLNRLKLSECLNYCSKNESWCMPRTWLALCELVFCRAARAWSGPDWVQGRGLSEFLKFSDLNKEEEQCSSFSLERYFEWALLDYYYLAPSALHRADTTFSRAFGKPHKFSINCGKRFAQLAPTCSSVSIE